MAVSWGEDQTQGLPRCLNCGHAVSVKGDPRHGGNDVPEHHFWTEDEKCHPDDLKRWRGQTKQHGGIDLKVRTRHGT
jgi:hypothetical protein